MNKAHGIVALVVTASLLVASIGLAGAASGTTTEKAIVVDLEEDGSATITVRSTYDLSSDAQRAAFEELRSDDGAIEELRTTFRERMRHVVESAGNATGREMAITDASVDLAVVENTGVVELAITWDRLAAVEDDRLVVTEPFASGFAPDRTVIMQPPDGYSLADASPSPDVQENELQWNAGTDIDGFDVSFEDSSTDGTATSGPGFGVVAAILGILTLIAVGLRD